MEQIKLTPISFAPVRKHCRINIQNKKQWERAKHLEKIWTIITAVNCGLACIFLVFSTFNIINVDNVDVVAVIFIASILIAVFGTGMMKYYGVKYWKLKVGKIRH